MKKTVVILTLLIVFTALPNQIELMGFGEWLVSVGIGTLLNPMLFLAEEIPFYSEIFTDGTWEAFTTVGSESYNPLLGPIIIFQIFATLALVFLSTSLTYLSFSKRHLYPKFYIALITAVLLIISAEEWVGKLLEPNEPMFDAETTKDFAFVLICGLIVVPYLLYSERVKAIFVEKMPKGSV